MASPERVRRFRGRRLKLDRAERQIVLAASTRRDGPIACREVLAKDSRRNNAGHQVGRALALARLGIQHLATVTDPGPGQCATRRRSSFTA